MSIIYVFNVRNQQRKISKLILDECEAKDTEDDEAIKSELVKRKSVSQPSFKNFKIIHKELVSIERMVEDRNNHQDEVLKFTKIQYQLQIPFFIVADFEMLQMIQQMIQPNVKYAKRSLHDKLL